MTKNPYAAYASTSVLSADPVTLTTMLFDGALKAIRKAKLQHEIQNRQGYLDAIERSSLIIGELLASLDMSQGEIPERLSGIYAFCLRRLVDATIGGPAPLNDVESNITTIAEAWKAATANYRGAAQPARASSAA